MCGLGEPSAGYGLCGRAGPHLRPRPPGTRRQRCVLPFEPHAHGLPLTTTLWLWWGCAGRIPGLRLEATPATHAFIRRLVDDNLMTSRHHAEEALRALRAVDLQPRPAAGPRRDGAYPEEEGGSGEEEPAAAGTAGPCAPGQCPQCGSSGSSRGAEAALHACPQCGQGVCRRCLGISVFDKASGAVCRICRYHPLHGLPPQPRYFSQPNPLVGTFPACCCCQAVCGADLPAAVQCLVGLAHGHGCLQSVGWREPRGLQLRAHGGHPTHRDQGKSRLPQARQSAWEP